MDVLLANPRGFCAGVERAIEIVERAIELHGAPIYVRHEIVHNKFVVDRLRAKGAVFVETLEDVERLHVRTPEKLAYVTQTTLSVDDARAMVAALKKRFPKIRGPKK